MDGCGPYRNTSGTLSDVGAINGCMAFPGGLGGSGASVCGAPIRMPRFPLLLTRCGLGALAGVVLFGLVDGVLLPNPLPAMQIGIRIVLVQRCKDFGCVMCRI